MKKGFTLIELLSVIAILALIMIIALPSIMDLLENAKIKAYQDNELMMNKAVKNYLTSNRDLLPQNVGETTEVTLSDLQSSNYISEVADSEGSCNGYVLVTKLENGYSYNPNLKCGKSNTIGSSSEDGLVAHYELSGNAIDNSVNNFNGTINGAIAIKDRHNNENKAMYFDGNDFINLGDNSLLKPEDVTYMAWIKASEFVNCWHGIISSIPSWGSGFGIQIGDCQNFAAMISGSYLKTKWTPVIESWYHIAATHNSSDNQNHLYVNGKLENKSTHSVTYASNALTMIGAFYVSPSLYFKGTIDDVKIYNRPLTAEEIKYIYNIEK